MAKIREYDSNQLRQFAVLVSDSYKKNETMMFTFEDWKQNTFSLLAEQENIYDEYPKDIRIAPSTEEIVKIIADNRNRISQIDNLPEGERALARLKLFREIIQPAKVIHLEKPIVDPRSDTPIWFGSTLKSADLYIGYKNGDSSLPYAVKLADPEPGVSTVHAKMSGGTGSGKSVTMHTLVTNVLLYYPPWEVQLYLADFKKVEFSKYNSPIQTPHVRVVAASENMTFVQSVMNAYDQEMARRQTIFTEVGCEKLEDFRKKYNMIMPRCLFICDEFGQVKANLKSAESMGSTTTGEEKQSMDRVLHRIGTLGRSMGMHMVISSQSLVGAFQEETDKQFGGGIALKVNDPSDSKSVIGNDASAYIRGKGKGYVNLNKAAQDEKDNVLVRIPFIDAELSEKDLLSGRQTYLTETVGMVKKLSDDLGIETNLFYYNDDALESFSKFEGDVKCAIDRTLNSPYEVIDEKTKIQKEVFLSKNAISFAVGRQVTFSEDSLAFLDVEFSQNMNILISGNDFDTYALRLLAGNIKMYMDEGFNIENYVYSGDISVFKFSHLEELLGLNDPNYKSTLISGTKIPTNGYNKIQNRKTLFEISEKLKDNFNLNQMSFDDLFDSDGDLKHLGYWDSKIVLKQILSEVDRPERQYGMPVEELLEMAPLIDNLILMDTDLNDEDSFKEAIKESGLADTFLKVDDEGVEDFLFDTLIFRDLFAGIVRQFNTLYMITGFKRFVQMSDFSLCFNWLIGAESFDEVTTNNYDAINQFKLWTMIGPKFGVFTIMTASNWKKASKLTDNFNCVIEKENKSFFFDINMKPSINIYKLTFQIHNRELSTRQLVKEFKLD